LIEMLVPSHSDPPLPAAAERLELTPPSGERLVGVRLPPASTQASRERLILGFGGNAWNADVMALYLHGVFPDEEIVTFHYRGYTPSSGSASAQAVLSDALTVFDHLQHERKRQVIAVGFSIGSGVATYLGSQRPLAGLILVTPFDSLEALALDHYPWAPVGLLLRHHMPTINFVRDVRTPTALIAAGRDTIVPAQCTEPLRRAIPHLILDHTIADAGHNDLYNHPTFASTMRSAVEQIEGAMNRAGSL
jgi:pimeloyl-ACP methyl ester carboxylesterase